MEGAMKLAELRDLAKFVHERLHSWTPWELEIRQIPSLQSPQVAISWCDSDNGDEHAPINTDTGLPILTIEEARDVLEKELTDNEALEKQDALNQEAFHKERALSPHLSDFEYVMERMRKRFADLVSEERPGTMSVKHAWQLAPRTSLR